MSGALSCLVALLLLVGCTPRLTGVYEQMYPEPRSSSEQAVIEVCGRHGALCVPDPTVLGRINRKTLDFGGVELRAGVIRYNPDTCDEDPVLCRFILLHEIGHREKGADQTAADCWAARYASAQEVRAGLALLRRLERPRAKRLVRCSGVAAK